MDARSVLELERPWGFGNGSCPVLDTVAGPTEEGELMGPIGSRGGLRRESVQSGDDEEWVW
jgi:hypothetical protein